MQVQLQACHTQRATAWCLTAGAMQLSGPDVMQGLQGLHLQPHHSQQQAASLCKQRREEQQLAA